MLKNVDNKPYIFMLIHEYFFENTWVFVFVYLRIYFFNHDPFSNSAYFLLDIYDVRSTDKISVTLELCHHDNG